MRIAAYTTAYPAARRFLPEWYASMASQSDTDFELWVGLDGMDEADFFAAIGARPQVNFIHGRRNASPAGLRSMAMSEMVARHDAVVFTDADDVLCPSRVELARQHLRECDVAACSLRIIDECGRDLGITFGPAGSHAVDDLARYNVFGLSNTAWRSAVLERCLPVQDECVLVDWLLATRAWSAGASLYYDPVPAMKYRQYANNTAAVLGPFTPDLILQATRRVIQHYRCALTPEWRLRADVRAAVESASTEVTAFHHAVTASAGTLNTYAAALNELPRQYVWWWAVAHPDLEAIWRH